MPKEQFLNRLRL